jgi:hypothetical protein
VLKRCEASQTKDVKAAHYIQVMLASTDFTPFVNLMRTMRKLHGERLDKEDDAEMALKELTLGSSKKKKKKKKKKMKTSGAAESKDGDDDGDDGDDDDDDNDSNSYELREIEDRPGGGGAKETARQQSEAKDEEDSRREGAWSPAEAKGRSSRNDDDRGGDSAGAKA